MGDMIREFGGKRPKIDKTAFLAETAVVIGDVEIGEESSIWPGAVLRGDQGSIRIGKNTNVQDNSVVHGRKTIVGDNVTVGHGAIIHSSKVGSNCLIGMGSILLNDSVIGDNTIIGAGALVKEKDVIPEDSLAVGLPAKVVRKLDRKELESILKSAEFYRKLALGYK